MDVDKTGNVPGADAAPAAPDESQESQELITELSRLLDRIERNPANVRAIRRQIDIMVMLGMLDEAAEAIASLSTLSVLGEGIWLKLLDARIAALATVDLDTFADMLDLFAKAQNEYLSAEVIRRHMAFLVRLSAYPPEDGAYPALVGDDEVREYVDASTAREMLQALVSSVGGLLGESQGLWELWMEWEMRALSNESGDTRKEQIQRIHEMYLARLQLPHATLDATSSAYSTWISQTCPDEYEARMVQATAASQVAKAKWTERRQGKTRADFEEQLAYTPDAGSQLAIFIPYLEWELTVPNPKVKTKGRSKTAAAAAPEPDRLLARAVFERTLLAYGRVVAQAEEASFAEEATQVRGQTNQMLQMASQYKTAEAGLWVRYVDYVIGYSRKHRDTADEDDFEGQQGDADVAEVAGRACRACPTCGELWARQLEVMEQNNDVPGIETTVAKAKGLIVGNKRPVADLVDLLYAHAAIFLRRYRSVEPSLEHPLFFTLTAALETMTENYDAGDSSLRLEKFFISWIESVAPELLPGVFAVLEPPVTARAASHQFAILVANAQARIGDIDAARNVYASAITRWDLDWPEAVYEAYIMFENVHGDLHTLLDAREQIDKQLTKVNRRRQKEAEKLQAAAAEEYRVAVAAQAAAPAPAPVTEQVEVEVTSSAMDVDPTATPAASIQVVSNAAAAAAPAAAPAAAVPAPSAESAATAPATERTKPEPLKRDRENTTVLVTGLKKGSTAERVTAFFENWGKVRECTMLPGAEQDAAMVEYQSADAIPTVLEKDRRRFDGAEIHVSMLWRSTLFVTNFPPTADDAALRTLFSQYGTILQTRWPSRKYADSRRFCYITMEAPAAAQEALVLHKFKMDGGTFPMTVLISDPSARKQRSDEANSTLFVGGLTSKTTEADLRKLFAKYGTLINAKLGWDNEKKVCRGFAFVEMSTQAEAKAAIDGANGTPYHGRGLKVTLSDTSRGKRNQNQQQNNNNHNSTNNANAGNANTTGPDSAWARSEQRARKVRLYDLPPGTQEGLLQQALEKIVPVARLEVFEATQQAVAELKSQHDVGVLTMRPEPFVFNGTTLRIADFSEVPKVAKAPSNAGGSGGGSGGSGTTGGRAPLPSQSSLAFAPRTRKPAKALGKAYVAPKGGAATRPPAAAAVPRGSGQDAFRAFMSATNEQRKDRLVERVASASLTAPAAAAAVAGTPAAPADAAPVSASTLNAGEKHSLDADADAASNAGSEAKRAKVDDK